MTDLATTPEIATRVAQLLTELLGTPDIGSYIGGEMVTGAGETLDLTDPASGKVFAQYRDAARTLWRRRRRRRLPRKKIWWRKTAAERGGRILFEIGRQIRLHAASLSELEALSAGRPIRDAGGEPARMAEMFEYYAGWCDKITGDVIPVPTTHLNYTRHEPLGVVAQITPWNAPLFTCCWQVAPAICAGNGGCAEAV